MTTIAVYAIGVEGEYVFEMMAGTPFYSKHLYFMHSIERPLLRLINFFFCLMGMG